jgi:hypothetical protein
MKRSSLWLTMVIAFSLPTLIFAQCTGGCKAKHGAATGTPSKKGAAHKELARKGAGNAPKTTGNGNTPKVESNIGKISETDTGKKGKVEPTTSARKKPPRPKPANPPDQK